MKRVAVIGSGPAGFYTSLKLLKKDNHIQVDMIEALPSPFGLIRYGVAPDHPEVKAVQNKFQTVTENKNFQFIGNVSIGKNVTLEELQQRYHVICLAIGAAKDRKLNIPGEDTLIGIHAARDFVSWYNGLPSHKNFDPKLHQSEEAVIIGQGNVALDIARVLLSPIDVLRKTDMTEYSLQALSESRVKSVRIIGRRGPSNVAFTPKEFREMTKIPNVMFNVSPFTELANSKKRILQMLYTESCKQTQLAEKSWKLDFLLSPSAFLSQNKENHVDCIRLEKNLMKDSKAIGTGEFIDIHSNLVFRSIGYQHVPIPGIPFDHERGRIPTNLGRILTTELDVVPGMYASGWLSGNPSGVIATTMFNSYQTAESILSDLKKGIHLPVQNVSSQKEIVDWLKLEKHCKPITYSDWKKVEAYEVELGKRLGKPREKIVDLELIFKIINDK